MKALSSPTGSSQVSILTSNASRGAVTKHWTLPALLAWPLWATAVTEDRGLAL
eukprot:CAMPEP_0168468420 /NCGR_PEP_ID=MMETSP0228-20121227/57696_1 /TAXON_ID=133427 /ORGANISM="Protoceratium reticulatum, Strain CCCM 535 (=CCMP 1889)" /LENGTH=52 /DNA_ID=CAMNT_0008484175 /DNA_START=120 /DNA_END=275 /DNA_ORIENTATION=+